MAVVVLDNFTDTGGTSLDAHTPDTRPGSNMWTERVGDWRITNNRADLAAAVNASHATIDSGVADCLVSASVQHDTGSTSVSRDVGVIVRYTDASNYWIVSINENAGAFRITQMTSGAPTTRANTAVSLTAGTFYTILVTLDGNTITATLDGGNQISYASASQGNTSTVHGIFGRDISPTCQIEWFQAETADSPVSISLAAAGITSGGQALTISLATTINLASASITSAGQSATVSGGAVSINLGAAGIIASGPDIAPCYQYTDSYGGDVNTGSDLLISAGWPTYNGGQHTDFDLDPINPQRALLRFNLSAINAAYECIRAVLYLYTTGGDEGGGNTIGNVYSVASANGNWIEGTKDIALASAGEPCWNAKEADGSGGVQTAWAGSAGCSTSGTDYEATALGSYSFAANLADGTEIAIELTPSRIEDWFGTSNTNYGIILVTNDGNNSRVGSAENSTTGYRPKLVVFYHPVVTNQTINLGTGSISAGGQNLTVQEGEVSVSLDAGQITAAGQGLDVQPGSVAIPVNAGNLTAGAQAGNIQPGAAAVAMGSATLAAGGQTIDPIPGSTTISMGVSAITSGGQAITISAPGPGSVTISLGVAGIMTSGPGSVIQPGAASITLTAAALGAIGQTALLSMGAVSVILDAGGMGVNGITLSIGAGAASIALDAAQASAAGQSLNISAPAPGDIAIILGAGGLLASGQGISIDEGTIPTTAISLESGSLFFVGQGLQPNPGAVSIGLDPGTILVTALVAAVTNIIARYLSISDDLVYELTIDDAECYSITIDDAECYSISVDSEA